MELKLDAKEIREILLVHVNRLMPEAGFNRIAIHARYGSLDGATFDHTEIKEDQEPQQ